MKILHIAEGIQETCGVSCFVMEIAKAQAAEGHDVCIVTRTTCSYPVGNLNVQCLNEPEQVDFVPMVYLGTGTHVPQFDKERCAGEGLNKDIKIGDGCWLCARTTILPGVTVGSMTIVGAGAVVNKNLPGGITAVGIPAEPLEK